MQCRSCGAENPEGFKFCGQCAVAPGAADASPLANAAPQNPRSSSGDCGRVSGQEMVVSRAAIEGMAATNQPPFRPKEAAVPGSLNKPLFQGRAQDLSDKLIAGFGHQRWYCRRRTLSRFACLQSLTATAFARVATPHRSRRLMLIEFGIPAVAIENGEQPCALV
jgi:hypothetical protein